MTEAARTGTDLQGGRRASSRRSVPFVQQLEAADCGAACLAMVLAYHGHEVPLSELRDAVGVGIDGIGAERLLEVARRYGLAGRALRAGIAHLRALPRGTILHWQFCHYVVLDEVSETSIRIVDPAVGRRQVPWALIDEKFTGAALTFDKTERFVPRRQRKSRLMPYLRRLFADRGLLFRVLAMTATLQALAMAVPAVTGVVVDGVVPRRDFDLLWIVAAGSALAVVFSLLSALVRGHLLVSLRTRLDMSMTADFMSHLSTLPCSYFQCRSTGDLMMRVNSNAAVREFLTSEVVTSLLDGLMVAIYLVAILFISWSMALIALVLGLVRVVLILAVHGRLRELMANQLDARAQCQSYLAQMLAGIETLKSAGAEGRAVEHWSNLYTRELNEASMRGWLESTARSVLRAFDLLSPLLLLSWGAFLVLSGDLTLGRMLALNAFAIAFFTPLSMLANSGLQLSMLGGHLDRMDDVLEAEPEQDPSRALGTPRLYGRISLRDVSFGYRRGGPLAIEAATLDIAPGTTVAIVGPSGCGKSTLARILLGLQRPQGGSVSFDDQDIAHLDLIGLRRQIGIVPQDPYFFAASVRSNIALGDPGAPLHRVVEAARLAKIHGHIMRLPMQYDTVLADRGATLSGGQRQRIALARALLRRPAILLLDEATSALDAETEESVTRNLERLRCTKIVIAHRLSTIANADMIVVLENGRIVEVGRHHELLRAGKTYARLVGTQTRIGQLA